jgi:hypothetical protein
MNPNNKLLTLILPEQINERVAIEFFKAIYNKVDPTFSPPLIDDFSPSEMQSFFQLSDVFYRFFQNFS